MSNISQRPSPTHGHETLLYFKQQVSFNHLTYLVTYNDINDGYLVWLLHVTYPDYIIVNVLGLGA